MNPYFNENTVLEYIKKNLGVPYNIMEFTDEYIVNNIIRDQTFLKEFSQFFPKEERLILDESNRYYKEEDKSKDSNIWILNIKNEILGVKKVISNPINNPLAYYTDMYTFMNPVESATFDLTRSMLEKPITHKFMYPNRLEIKGFYRPGKMMAILEVVHDNDLSSIPSSLHLEYNKLSLYNTAQLLLPIRMKYSNLSTPFGEINVNADMLQQLADKKYELIQSFASPANFAPRGLGIIVG